MPESRYVLGIDLGTSSLKCIVMDGAGKLHACAERSYPTSSPQAGWAEQNPEDWIEALREAVSELQAAAPGLVDRVEAIGLCSAAHIPVLLDEKNDVIRPAILWSDQRSEAEVAFLREKHGALLEEVALNEAGCTWTLPQLLWVWNNEPKAPPKVRRILSSKDYLIFRLTGQYAMDPASAAATLMMDTRKKEWSPALIALSRMPATSFPALVAPADCVGVIDSETAKNFGLPAGAKVIAGTLDSAAEMLGCGILSPGRLGMVRVGSAGGIMAVTATPSHNQGVITYPHLIDGLFYKQAGTNACATSLKWLREVGRSVLGDLGGDTNAAALSYENLDRLAATVQPGSDGLLFHPYIQGERAPHWNPDLRGSFTGLSLNHRWPHFVRAVMEGVAFSLLDCLNMFRRDGLDMTSAVMAGGVAKSPLWSRIITDVLGMETTTIRQGDSALGAAMIAALGAGIFTSIGEAVDTCVHRESTLAPTPRNHAFYSKLFERYQKTSLFLGSLESMQDETLESSSNVC